MLLFHSMIAYLIHLVFLIFTMMIFVRIVGSWFPAVAGHPLMGLVARCTDPYLNAFRKVIPPIGGRLDLSPLLGFFVLQIAEQLLMTLLR
ncbi:MAG: YggT family protein [Chlamydiales bacterium]